MRRRLLPFVPVLVVSALVVPSGAAAESPPPFPDYPDMVAAYVRDYPGIPLARARTAVLTQGNRIRMLEELGRTAPTDLGSNWYDPRTNTQHVDVTSDAAAATVRAAAARHGLSVAVGRAQYRMRDLEALAKRLNAQLTPDMVRSVFAVADHTTNRVKVIAKSRSRADEARARHAKDGRVVVVEATGGDDIGDACTSRTSCGAPFRAGITVGLDWDGSGPGTSDTSCSAGFTAASSDGSKWMITAGHCAGDWQDAGVAPSCAYASTGGCWGHGQQYWGPLRDNWPYGISPHANVDVARARKDNAYWSAGGYMYNPSSTNSPYDVDLAITMRTTLQVGETVCHTAQHTITGMTCGTIVDTAASERSGLVKTTYDLCPGDSGGGWYMNEGTQRWAVGIHSRSNPSDGCHVAGGYSYFSAVPDINAYWDATTVGAVLRFETR
ncbi:MAG TPA: S1 family peptidase [Frankiaceae bacterium]|jgi:streptogrisin C|nr:S1 family peptidase [Frankiaceae bacterium]